MKIEAITVCVDYIDLLKLSLGKWIKEVDRLVVVTAPRDEATIRFCEKVKNEKLRCHVTDIFYANGASFNKGAAMEEALNQLDLDDWVLFFDSDIYLPSPQFRQIAEEHAKPGNLYGAPRFQVQDVDILRKGQVPVVHPIPDVEFAGYFQFFHTSDTHICDPSGKIRRPLLSTHWKHAGNYDSDFQNHWDPQTKIRLPLPVFHLGNFNQNWFGISDPEHQSKMQSMYQERHKRGGLASQDCLDQEKI